jgi:hypothetical protein
VVVLHGSQPFRQGLPSPVLCYSGDKLCIVLGMTFARIRLLIVAAQLLLRKLADGLVHAVTLALGIRPKDHQRVVDQFGEDLGAWLPWCADSPRRLPGSSLQQRPLTGTILNAPWRSRVRRTNRSTCAVCAGVAGFRPPACSTSRSVGPAVRRSLRWAVRGLARRRFRSPTGYRRAVGRYEQPPEHSRR